MSLLPLLVGFFGCGGTKDDAPPPGPATPAGLESSWVTELVTHPATFEQAIGGARDGWIALHKNAWADAAAAGGAPGTRAATELAELHTVLADLSGESWRSLGDTWERRGTLPTDSAIPMLVALAARDAGDEVAAARWEKLPARADPAVNARKEQHAAMRSGAGAGPDIGTFRTLVGAPLLEEPIAGSDGKRILWDPLVHRSLAAAWSVAAATPLSTTDRGLFSGRIDPAESSPAATLSKLGIPVPTTDDAEACREAVRGLDRLFDPWKASLAATAPPDGQALLSDLQLVEGLRARLLVSGGVEALASDRPRCALAFAEMALDHEAPRAITPRNSPTLFAVLAAANLRTGHTREALDALEVLVAPFPEVVGLDETVGDLAVLQGLDRTGDSREN